MKLCLFADAQSVHIQQLAPRLASRGVDVHVVTHKPADVTGCTVERFSVPGAGLTNLRRWERRRRAYLASFLRDFDVVNVHFLADWGFCAHGSDTESLLDVGCLVASAWGSDIVDPPGETSASPELVEIRRTTVRRAAMVTACGPTFARLVEHFGDLESGSVEIGPFGVDVDLFTRRGELRREGGPNPRIGFFKGFRPVYGADRLIRAIPPVVEQVPGVRFDMVGDGPDLPRCRALANSWGVERAVTWHPRQPLAALPEMFATWDVSVIPSVHEAFGVAALESAAMGVPVVASDVGGLRDTVRQNETGCLVDTSQPAVLAGALVELVQDDRRRERMAAAGRAMVERAYQWRDLTEVWVALYERARQRRCVMV